MSNKNYFNLSDIINNSAFKDNLLVDSYDNVLKKLNIIIEDNLNTNKNLLELKSIINNLKTTERYK